MPVKFGGIIGIFHYLLTYTQFSRVETGMHFSRACVINSVSPGYVSSPRYLVIVKKKTFYMERSTSNDDAVDLTKESYKASWRGRTGRNENHDVFEPTRMPSSTRCCVELRTIRQRLAMIRWMTYRRPRTSLLIYRRACLHLHPNVFYMPTPFTN